MGLADRFRARLTAGRQALALPAPRPRLALPAPPRRRQDPAEVLPLCRFCRTRHQPRPHPTAAGRGVAAAYARRIVPDPTRPEPLNRHADPVALQVLLDLERHRPWSP